MRRATAVLVLAAMLAIGGPAAVVAAHQPSHEFRKVRVPPGMAVYEWTAAGDLYTHPGAAAAAVPAGQRLPHRLPGDRELPGRGRAADTEDPTGKRGYRRIRRQIQRFVATAASFGLSVQALGGGPRWTGETHRYLGPKVVELVGNYNTRVALQGTAQGGPPRPGAVHPAGLAGRRASSRRTWSSTSPPSRASWRPTGRSWTGGPTAACSSASPSRSGWTAAATPRARSSSAADQAGRLPRHRPDQPTSGAPTWW